MLQVGKVIIYNQAKGIGKIIFKNGEKQSFNIDNWSDFEILPSVGISVKVMENKIVPLSDNEILSIEDEKVQKEKIRQELLPIKNYEELKKYLLEIYKPYGFTKETIFSDNSWLLEKENDKKSKITISILSKTITFLDVDNIIQNDELSGYMIIQKSQGKVRKRINLLKQKDKDELLRENQQRKSKDMKSSNNIMVIFLVVIVCLIALSVYSCSDSKNNGTTNVSNSSYCYNLGFKQGSCIARSMKGQKCKKGTDIVMPLECRNTSSGERGIAAGIKSEK